MKRFHCTRCDERWKAEPLPEGNTCPGCAAPPCQCDHCVRAREALRAVSSGALR